MVLPSTGRNGTVTRIVTSLPDEVVTTPRSDVDVVVTEHGVAHLRGKSLSERAKALIAIAHPDFREDLRLAPRRAHFESLRGSNTSGPEHCCSPPG